MLHVVGRQIMNILEQCTHRIYHDLDHLDNLDLNLPLGDVVNDLYGTDPTQERCPRSSRFYGFHPAT